MKQRVVMVLSSLLDPSLLIADEVTSALDVSTQRAVAELLVEFRDRGFVKSMIVITHDLSVLYQIADTILVMYAGKLAEKAPAETIVSAPQPPVHAAPDLLAARGRRPLRRDSGSPGSPAGRRRCSTRRPAAASATAARSRSSSARRSRRSSRSSRATRSRAGRLRPDARARRRARRSTRSAPSARSALRAVSDVSFQVAPGEVVSLIGESGSGKSHDRPDDPPALRATERDDHASTATTSRASEGAAAAYYARRAGRLPGPVQLVQPDLQGRPGVRARAGRTSPGSAAPSGTRSSSVRSTRSARARRLPRQVPASAQRRPAPAHADRAGAPARHPAARRRRDHQHARRLDPDRRAQPARRPEGARPRHPLHHPRPLARQLHLRPHGDPAARRGRRDGRDREGLRQPAPSVHADAARVGAAAPHEVVDGHAPSARRADERRRRVSPRRGRGRPLRRAGVGGGEEA